MGLDANWMVLIEGGHLTCFWCLYHHFRYSKWHSENFKFPCSDLESPLKMGLDASWTVSIGEHHLTCSRCPHCHFGYSGCYRHIQWFWFADLESPPKMSAETDWIDQIRGGQNLKPPGLGQYFGFSGPIRKGIKLGPPDLEPPCKGAPGDTWMVRFGAHLKCMKNAPLPRWYHTWHPLMRKHPDMIDTIHPYPGMATEHPIAPREYHRKVRMPIQTYKQSKQPQKGRAVCHMAHHMASMRASREHSREKTREQEHAHIGIAPTPLSLSF